MTTLHDVAIVGCGPTGAVLALLLAGEGLSVVVIDREDGPCLEPRAVHLDGEVIKMRADNFFEAAWVFKRNGTYYFAYSTTPKAAMRIDYMTSDKPTSGFTYRGPVADQPPINNNNNHASQFEFKGQWYHVYHNRIVAKQAGIPTGFRRNIALERFSFKPDGSIEKVTYTEDGVPQVGHLNPYAKVEAETFAAQSGVETEPCEAGGMQLCALANGDWVRIKGVDFGAAGAKSFAARVGGNAAGRIEIRLGGPDGTQLGTCEVKTDGSANGLRTVRCEVAGATGVKDLCLRFVGDGDELFKLDSWIFQ